MAKTRQRRKAPARDRALAPADVQIIRQLDRYKAALAAELVKAHQYVGLLKREAEALSHRALGAKFEVGPTAIARVTEYATYVDVKDVGDLEVPAYPGTKKSPH